MTTAVPSTTGTSRRTRAPGRPAKLTRELIVEAARTLDHESLTLTAVAERLGVVRNAVAYHVRGRQELVALVAARDLAERLEALDVPRDDWRAAIRTVGHAMYEALVDEKALAVLATGTPSYTALRPSEGLLTALLGAGFDEETAGCALSMLTEIVFTAARQRLERTANGGTHPQYAELVRTLEEDFPDDFPSFRRVAVHMNTVAATPERSLELLIAGLAARTEPLKGHPL